MKYLYENDHWILAIIAQDYKGDSCTICGNPQHTYDNCNNKHRLDPNGSRKIYSPKYLKKDRTKLENNQDINNKYRHIISPKRKTIPIPSVSTFMNHNGKRPIVPTISNNRSDTHANARIAKQQPSIQPQLNTRHEKQLIKANKRILKLENALNNLSSKYDMLEQQFKMINTQHNTTHLHKTPFEYIARRQYSDDLLHFNNLSRNQVNTPEMEIDYSQPQQEETETHYGTTSQLDSELGYVPANPTSDADTDNHTIDNVVHPSELSTDNNCSSQFDFSPTRKCFPLTTNINFENRPISNLNDLLTLNVINELNLNSIPSYNPIHNQYFIDYVRIGTINIQNGFNTKKDDINLFFKQENFDILGLIELGLVTSDKFPRKEYFDNHVLIYDTSDTNDRNSGVALIISKPFYKHIAKIKSYKGRLICIDLFFKNHPVKIINTYIHANNTKTQSIKDLTEQLFQLILEANTNNYNLIVMGDFNVNPQQFIKTNQKTQNAPSWKQDILRKLKRFNLAHSVKYFQNRYLPTRTPQTSNDTPTVRSCIDHIYISQKLLDATFNSNTLQINNTFFSTDHKCVYILVDQQFFRSRKNLKASTQETYRPNNHRRKTYNYNSMNKDKWSHYTTESKKQLDKLSTPYTKDNTRLPMLTDLPFINKKWLDIKSIIESSKLQTIPTYKSLNKIQHCNPDMDPTAQWSMYWSSWPLHRRSLLESNKLFHNILFDQKLPSSINQFNFSSTKKIIRKALLSAKTLYKEEKDIHTLNNINNYVIQRNDNLQNNQRCMINSILDRKPRTIVLDHLLYTDDSTNSRILTHDKKTIEDECIKHFQLLNGSQSDINHVPIFQSIQDLLIEFQELYSPIPSVNPSLYNTVTSPITINELKDFINKLPLHKSAGNLGIHYENLKHLHEDVLLLILDLFNNILSTGIIPKDWNHALLYPIPKPKDWGSEINNTRPIILLESTRKLFTKILTSRLHQVLSHPNIIQPNNRAGLIGESTLQPLQHLHHTIEMANIQGKTIWIGLQDLSKAYDRINVSLLKLSLKRLYIPDVIVDLLCNLFSNYHNQIILPNRLSREYDILQGIDQGEINIDKYKLLTNDLSKCVQTVNLAANANAPVINITTTGKNDGERILGVYVNAFNKPSPTYKKMKATVNHFAFLLRCKRITHNHIIYIINKILIPILEYRSQFQIFSFKECEALMAPIKKIFKNSLHLPISTHDNLIYNKLFPSINNFFFHRLYCQSALVNLLFNSPLLKPIALQQILQFQYDF
ncbi:hypothetical protein RclHR1_03760007 [Rhizophagus clarus]|uniref:Endonuclease/exonuclease/phosphatase domain-containing protein n=1 Tax=Rhizophagus clarus TaxID=94130 RepID=A0A2Z6RGH2_9GLOM|nr:hypothetical protein RclHR1_03760007 [Rhizophagus clarus]